LVSLEFNSEIFLCLIKFSRVRLQVVLKLMAHPALSGKREHDILLNTIKLQQRA